MTAITAPTAAPPAVERVAGPEVGTEAPARNEAVRGALDMALLLAGYAPFAFVLGAAIGSHSSPAAGWTGTWLVYGGSAHLTLLRMIDGNAGILLMVATGLVVNARLLVYSAALAPLWKHESLAFRAVAAATVVDPSWAVATKRYGEDGDPAAKRLYYVGAAATLWFGWATLITVGVFAGSVLPSSVGLEMAVPLCIAALVVPSLTTRPMVAAVCAAAIVAVPGMSLPAGTGMLAAILAGVVAGLAAEGLATREAREGLGEIR